MLIASSPHYCFYVHLVKFTISLLNFERLLIILTRDKQSFLNWLEIHGLLPSSHDIQMIFSFYLILMKIEASFICYAIDAYYIIMHGYCSLVVDCHFWYIILAGAAMYAAATMQTRQISHKNATFSLILVAQDDICLWVIYAIYVGQKCFDLH